MTTYQLTKSMTHELTLEQDEEILLYLKSNPDEDIDKVIDMFEVKFDCPITQHYIFKLTVRDMMGCK